MNDMEVAEIVCINCSNKYFCNIDTCMCPDCQDYYDEDLDLEDVGDCENAPK